MFFALNSSSSDAHLRPKAPGTFQTLEQEDFFWRRKKLQKVLKDERRIVVSTRKKEGKWHFKGGGWVLAPAEFVFAAAKDFKRLQKIPEHFTQVEFFPEKSRLNLKVSFLKREKDLELALFEESRADERRLYFEAVGSWLNGMHGVLVIKDLGRQESEVGVVGLYSGDFEWVPDFILTVGAEAVMHHVAESLRKAVETDYKMKQP